MKSETPFPRVWVEYWQPVATHYKEWEPIDWPDVAESTNLGHPDLRAINEGTHWKLVAHVEGETTASGWTEHVRWVDCSGLVQSPRPGLAPKQRGAAWYWSEP